MMMMTAKVNMKKLLLGLAAAVALIIALISILGGENKTDGAVTTMSDNDNRVAFLEAQGWQVTTSPTESGQVKIPREMSPVYSRYNDLQTSQGYDLSQYAGKTVMRYVYQVNNYPGATDPVYATLLVYKNQIIGGDITDTGVRGAVRGLLQETPTAPSTGPETTPDPE